MTEIDQQIKDATERIVKKFEEKQINLDAGTISKDLTNLVKNFEMTVTEAERTITAREARTHKVSFFEGRTTSGIMDIAAVKDKDWVTVEGKVVYLGTPTSKSVHQMGVLADRSGAIRFTVWARKKGVETPLTELTLGKSYRISNATIGTYNEALSMSLHKGTDAVEIKDIGDIKPPLTMVSEAKPGVVNIKGKVVRLFQATKDTISQVGLIGDNSGTIRFTTWKSEKLPVVDIDKSYVMEYAFCSEFGGTPSIVPTSIKEIKEAFDVKDSSRTFRGNIVQIRAGSGLVRRCPIEGCGRVMTRQNYCAVHEIQKDFVYDMRIKGVLDDGNSAKNIHVPLAVVESVTGIKLADAIKIAETSPLGMDEVLDRISEKIFGRYFDVAGTEYPDRIYVGGMTPVKPDMAEAKKILGGVV
jgi:replication factor A1